MDLSTRTRRGRRTVRWTALSGAGLLAMGLAPALLSASPASGTTIGATKAPANETRDFYDSRSSGSAVKVLQAREARQAARQAPGLVRLRQQLGQQGDIQIDPATGTPRIVARLDGFLTGPSGARATDVALGFVRTNGDVFRLSARALARLKLTRDYVDSSGVHHLSWAQTVSGVPLFGNGLKANVASDGRLVSVLGSPVADLGDVSVTARLSAKAALAAARSDVKARPTSLDRASRVLFQTLSGTRLGWQTVLMSSPVAYLHVIDAKTGAVLYRKSLTDSGSGKVVDYWPGAPRGGTQHSVDFTANGWIAANQRTRLDGNNSHTFSDVNDDNQAQSLEEVPAAVDHNWNYPVRQFFGATGRPCTPVFQCTWNPNKADSWVVNRAQNATQVFYYVNKYHDHLMAPPISFTEAAGNFQQVNSTGKGKGGDPVSTQPDDGADTAGGLPDGSHVDNANMSTPPDGISPTMQMYLFRQPQTSTDPFLASNGGDEADVVYHEYTHGLSNRLVVDANGVSTLDSLQAGAMGEAWSDWYAMDYLNNLGLQPDTAKAGEVLVGRYVSENQRLIRTQAIDCPVGSNNKNCPGTSLVGRGGYTYGDLGKIIGAPEVHADGEIWGETLWDLRSRLGTKLSEKLVTRAMELSPADPSFLDMRNAIVQADTVSNGGKARDTIWKVFAHRGMGYFAATINAADTHPFQDFSLPPAPGSARGSFAGRVVSAGTGAPIRGAVVYFGGHASGFPGANLATTTDANGHFDLRHIFVGTYRDVVIFAPGYDRVITTARIRAGTASTAGNVIRLRRDWASALKGGSVTRFTGPDFTGFGCGPINAIDQSFGQGWGSTSDLVNGKPSANTPKTIVVKLPTTVDISTFGVDPSNTCGDAPSAATGPYKVETSKDGRTFKAAAQGTFTSADLGRLNPVKPSAAAAIGVRYVRFTMMAPQVFQIPGATCPGAFSGCDFLDMTELEVYGTH